MEKARSRLSSHKESSFKVKSPFNLGPLHLGALTKYWKHLPTLVIGVVFLLPLLGIINWIQPATIQNLIFPNSYLPFLVLLFLSVFFLTSFLLLHSRRGFFAAFVITGLVFLKLQNFQLGAFAIGIPIISLFILEIFLSLLLKNQAQPDSS